MLRRDYSPESARNSELVDMPKEVPIEAPMCSEEDVTHTGIRILQANLNHSRAGHAPPCDGREWFGTNRRSESSILIVRNEDSTASLTFHDKLSSAFPR